MFKKILFDLDGTLTDPMIGITTCAQYALRHFGIEEDINNLKNFIGPPLVDSFTQFYGLTVEEAKEATKYYRERYAPIGKFENEIYEGIPEMLKELKEAGVVLAVASSKPEPFVEDILKFFDIDKYFDVVAGALMDETRTRKEEVMQVALDRLEVPYSGTFEGGDGPKILVPKQEVAMVGDRKFDVASARKMGITAVGVRFGYAEEGELEAENPDFIANTVDDLGKYLLS
ncbi:MAG: HAD hydrolase-like protein [Lachnospiraceae bacterium]|nr:HAD hydrolase-like protein [Lachnospiraceae bacterium]